MNFGYHQYIQPKYRKCLENVYLSNFAGRKTFFSDYCFQWQHKEKLNILEDRNYSSCLNLSNVVKQTSQARQIIEAFKVESTCIEEHQKDNITFVLALNDTSTCSTYGRILHSIHENEFGCEQLKIVMMKMTQL